MKPNKIIKGNTILVKYLVIYLESNILQVFHEYSTSSLISYETYLYSEVKFVKNWQGWSHLSRIVLGVCRLWFRVLRDWVNRADQIEASLSLEW